MKRIYNSIRFWKLATFILLALFVFNRAYPVFRHLGGISKISNIEVIESVQASEVYPMFTCPCCDQPLNREKPCCGGMTQMIDFIDQKISSKQTKDEVILATAKEFGIDRLANEEDQQALKKKLADLAPPDAPKIELTEAHRDLDEVSQAKGEVNTDFEFANLGKSDLVINKLSSSCGCTLAAIIYGGEVGPTFTMPGHGKENPTDWQVAIKPGDSAILRVYYDPDTHGDFTGPVTRTVSIFSNDPVEFETKVTITLEQIK